MDLNVLEKERASLVHEIANAEGSAREQRDDLDRLQQWIVEVESQRAMHAGARTSADHPSRICKQHQEQGILG